MPFSEVPSQRFHPFRRTRRKDLRHSATHRLTGPSYAYDASGNLTLADGVTYTYDPMHLTTTRSGDGTDWAAIYTADDERLAVWDTPQGTVQETWTLRGLDGLVLREYFLGVGLGGELIFADGFEDHPVEEPLCAWRLWDGTLPTCSGTGPSNPTWSVRGTYVYRSGALLADVSDASIRHYHLDHLGSVRQITDDEGVVAEEHDYLPYGTEVPGSSSGLRFTGHERDGHLAEGGDDLDYMHARYYSPGLGRFLSVDPVGGNPRKPQSWNRYAYTINNPLKYTDPTGQTFVLGGCTSGNDDQCSQQAQLLYGGLGAEASQYVSLNTKTGVVSLQGISAQAFGKQFGEFAQGVGGLIGSKDTFSLVTDSGAAISNGGGLFDPGRKGGGSIFIETGMFPRQTGDVTGTAQTALVHETGHAMRALFPSFFDKTNALFIPPTTNPFGFGPEGQLALRGEGYTVNFEDRFRQSRGLGIRHSYHPSLPDVLVDFGVNLFPPN